MRRAAGVVVLALVVAALAAGCRRGPEPEVFRGEPFLAVWAGDADRQSSDFLAILDADFSSPTYGKVVKTYPVHSRGNEPAGMTAVLRDDRRVFTTGMLTNRTFVFDLRQPLAGRLLGVDEAGPQRRLWAPHDVVSLEDGGVAVACSDSARFRGDPRDLLGAPGGLAVLDADGHFVRELPAADPQARHLIAAPNGAAAAPALGRLVTTSTGKGYTPTMRGDRTPGIAVQLWTWPDLRLVRTLPLPVGPRGEENLGPLTPTVFHHRPFVYVNTDQGGGLYVSDSAGTDAVTFRLAHDFGPDALAGGAAVTPDDRFYVVALGGPSRVQSLDVTDPWHPKPVSSVRLDADPLDVGTPRRGGPHALAMSADGTRIAVADWGLDVPGWRQDGDLRVYLLRLDPATGRLRLDGAFVDESAREVGVRFDRQRWPHGDTGAARPAALLFVAPAPPPKKGED
jgi:hypothetical protein